MAVCRQSAAICLVTYQYRNIRRREVEGEVVAEAVEVVVEVAEVIAEVVWFIGC